MSAGGKMRLLDAGSALNQYFFLSIWHLMDEMDMIDSLAPESVGESQRGISHHYCDLRGLRHKNSF